MAREEPRCFAGLLFSPVDTGLNISEFGRLARMIKSGK